MSKFIIIFPQKHFTFSLSVLTSLRLARVLLLSRYCHPASERTNWSDDDFGLETVKEPM
jgi:hypothetical protein